MALTLAPGLVLYKTALGAEEQDGLLQAAREIVAEAPLFVPVMPRTGAPFSVRMTNCGTLGWVADAAGYRYQRHHPDTGRPWPPIPRKLLELWAAFAGYEAEPEACLVNFYAPTARMGLHQDKDEDDPGAPVVSVSLGATALFRFGRRERRERTRSIRLESGDVLIMGGESRLCFHGIDRLYPGTSTRVADDGRLNLTLRRVTRPIAHRAARDPRIGRSATAVKHRPEPET